MMEPEREKLDEQEVAEIRRLVGRLRANNPVRRLALDLLDGGTVSEDDVRLAMETLRRRSAYRWRERAAAAWLLGRAPLSQQARESAVRVLRHVLDEPSIVQNLAPEGNRFWLGLNRSIRLAAYLMFPLMLIIAAYSGFNNSASTRSSPFDDIIVFLVCGVGGALFGSFFVGFMMSPLIAPISVTLDNRVRAAAAVALGHLKDPRSITALSGAARDLSPHVGQSAVQSLLRTLPTLQSYHYGQLGPAVVPNLCRLLNHPNESLVLEVIGALGQVGDGRAIFPVERAAAAWGRTSAIREASARILPILHERQRQEQDSDRLLRPTCAPDAPADILVRPAQGGMEMNPEILLRPASTD